MRCSLAIIALFGTCSANHKPMDPVASPQYPFGTTFPMTGSAALSGATWDWNVYLGTNLNFNPGAYFSYTNSYYVPVYKPGPSPTPAAGTSTGGTVTNNGGSVTTSSTGTTTISTVTGGTTVITGGTVIIGTTTYTGGTTTIIGGIVTNTGGTTSTVNGVTTIVGGTNTIVGGTVTNTGGVVTTQGAPAPPTPPTPAPGPGTTINAPGTTVNNAVNPLTAFVGNECQVPGKACPMGLYCQLTLGYNPYQVGQCQIDPGNYGGAGTISDGTSMFDKQKGSCRSPSQCGFQALQGKCWCDASCRSTGDCCDDFIASCPHLQPVAPTPYVPPTTPPTPRPVYQAPTSAPMTWENTTPAQHGDCTGKCGSRADHTNGVCYCDRGCFKNNDCCWNIQYTCPV